MQGEEYIKKQLNEAAVYQHFYMENFYGWNIIFHKLRLFNKI